MNERDFRPYLYSQLAARWRLKWFEFYINDRGVPETLYLSEYNRAKSILEELESGKVYAPEPLEEKAVIDGEKLYEIGLKYFLDGDWEQCFKHFSKCALLNEGAARKSTGQLMWMFGKGVYVEKDEKFADYLKCKRSK